MKQFTPLFSMIEALSIRSCAGKNFGCILIFLGMFTSGLGSYGQDAIGPFISTVGTTARERGNGRDWAYLLWTANSPDLLTGRAHAIYSKAGDANGPGLFTRVAIVSVQTEAITLEPLLRRAALLGEDTNSLHIDIDALFGKLTPQNLTLPEKLSAVVRGGLKDEKHFGRMILLSRTHPSVAMALGFGHAELIPAGQTTFEVREFDRATQSDGAVIGRVTVTAGAPTVLPAPGPPVELKRENARGHLNAQLRWGTPDDLRRLSLLQHGYNVWRVRKDFSDARNWGQSSPAANDLVSLSVGNTAVRRINYLPLLTAKTFNLDDAENFTPPPAGDPDTFFIIDDNDRGRSNIVTTLDFTNGARFVYFVTARDILGRDGVVSPGTEVQICNKLPPDAVSDVEVENDSVWVSNKNRQRLRVTWPQALNLPLAEQQIKAYWIYRWSSVPELRLKQANPTNNLIGIVDHIAGQAANTYLDNGLGAPTPANDSGKTFYYTVRAEDDGACEGNLSPHSAPVFGVLRDREGPAAPTGTVKSKCFDPSVDFVARNTNGTAAATGPLDATFQFTLGGVRADSQIAWMEFKSEVHPHGATNIVASFASRRLYFGNGTAGSFIAFPFDVPGDLGGFEMSVTATAGFANGESASLSIPQPIPQSLQKGDQRINMVFAGRLIEQRKDLPCNNHFAVGPANKLQPIELNIQPSPGSKEVRVYRRVDDGPLDLIYQRPLNSLNLFNLQDDSFPQGGARICYFACTLDEHGNSSPLTRLGCKFAFESSAPPRPQLSPIGSLEPESAPQMILSWFCPGVNVDRFEVGIATFGDPISTNCAPGYLQFIPPAPVPEMEPLSSQIVAAGGFPPADFAVEFRRFTTPRPGGDFGIDDQFRIRVDVQLDRRYLVYVKSIGKSGTRSYRSNVEAFFWQATPLEQPDVPWPPRPLPPVGNSFGLTFDAFFEPVCGSTNLPAVPVVRIAYDGYAAGPTDCPIALSGQYSGTDPNTLLPKNSHNESLFPVVLFRQQVTNENFSVVSGDVVQVSPMMESIAWGLNGQQPVILDPYILVERKPRALSRPGMYLRDTQPVVSGSRYRYFIARFNQLGELAEVIPAANELEAP
jgi:hypothetical protein